LEKLPKLKNLNLANTRISDVSLKQIADSKTIQVLDLQNTRVTDKSVVELSRMKHLQQLIAAAKNDEKGAVDALAKAGPRAIPGIVNELIRDDSSYQWAVSAMAKMGHPAVEPVAKLLNDSDYLLRKIAYMTLAEMGPVAKPAGPALQRAAQQDRDPRNRGLAAYAIRQIMLR